MLKITAGILWLGLLAQPVASAQGAKTKVPAQTSKGKGAPAPPPGKNVENTETSPKETPVKTPPNKTQPVRYKVFPIDHWSGLVAVNGSLVAESDVSAPEGHKDHSGESYGLDLIATYYKKKWVFDLGLGWSYTKLRGKEPFPNDPRIVDTEIATTAGALKTGARFRLMPYLEFGIDLQQWFSPDLSFSSYDSSPKTDTFGGVRLNYAYLGKKSEFRAGISYLVDLTIPKRRLAFTGFHIEFGLPVTKAYKRVAIKPKKPRDLTGGTVGYTIVRSMFDERIFEYQPGAKVPSDKTDAFLKDIANAVLAIKSNYNKLLLRVVMPLVEGGDDKAINTQAGERAELIKQKLIASGLPASKIKAVGSVDKKQTEPTRIRVEFNFVNVVDPAALDNVINGVRDKYGIRDKK